MPNTSEVFFNFSHTDIGSFNQNHVQFSSGTITTFDQSLLAGNDFNFKPEIKNRVSKNISDDTLNESKIAQSKKTEIKSQIQRVLGLIKSFTYEEGVWGITDHELVKINDNLGKADFLDICNGLWSECFKAKNQSDHAQLLNSFVNISDVVDSEYFLPYAISAMAHHDVRIKEAAIAMFERWDNVEHRKLLANVSDTGISWLDKYKHDVLETLGD